MVQPLSITRLTTPLRALPRTTMGEASGGAGTERRQLQADDNRVVVGITEQDRG